MKKYIIILLAALLVFSFVSCKDSGNTEDVAAEYEKKITEEQTKRESIVKNYEDFLLAKNYVDYGLWSAFKNVITGDGTKNFDNTTLNSPHGDEALYFVTLKEGETIASSGGSMTAKSGSVEAENVDSDSTSLYYNKDLTFTNVVVTVGYSVTKADGSTENKTAEVTLNGTFSVMRGIDYVTSKVNMTVGDKTYNASWTFDTSKSPWEYTAATVNGSNVELRLLAQTNTAV
jgi:hypothetical protein